MPPTPPPADLPFGVWLKAYRKHHGLNQDHLAAILHCSTSLISQMERGHRALSADAGQLLLRWADLPAEDLPTYCAWSAGRGPRPASASPVPIADAAPPTLRRAVVRPPPPRPVRRAVRRPPPPAWVPVPLLLPAPALPPLFPHWQQHLAYRWTLGVTAFRQSLLLYPVRSASEQAAQRAIWGWIALIA